MGIIGRRFVSDFSLEVSMFSPRVRIPWTLAAEFWRLILENPGKRNRAPALFRIPD